MAQKKSSSLIYYAVALVVVILMLIPMITQNHIYQGIAYGGDTKQTFIPLMNMATNGMSLGDIIGKSPYLGLALTMWLTGLVNRLLSINSGAMYYLYSCLILAGAGITLYYLGKLVGDKKGGWIVLVLGMLCSTSILALYTWGCTINILNLYIIFFWGVMLLAKWYQERRWYYIASGILLLCLFMVMHPTGIYLPIMAIVLIIGLMVWLIKKKKITWWMLIVLLVIIVGGLYLTRENINEIGIGEHNVFDADYIQKYFRLLFAPVPIIIGLLTLWAWIKNRKDIQLDNITKIMLVVLSSLFIVLAGASALQATVLPERQILDASAIMTIIIGIVLIQLIKLQNLQWLKVSSYALMSLQGLITLKSWII